jgi:hypothetical protein
LTLSLYAEDPKHVQLAMQLVSDIKATPEKNKFSTSNFELQISGLSGATDNFVCADSAMFAFMLLQKTYDWPASFVKETFSTDRVFSFHFYEAIKNEIGFKKIKDITELKSGDILVVDYLNQDKSADPGQVLIVVNDFDYNFVRKSDAKTYRFPRIGKTYQYLIQVLDCSGITHGGNDTRVNRASGAAGMGIFRIYIDEETKDFRGYTWEYNDESVFRNSGKKPPLIGRLK